MRKSRSGFTIVELLIVVVVIAILAAITIVAFNGIQQRARDSQRAQDMATIQKALEMYYTDNGMFPASGGAAQPNSAWSASQDSSWTTLETALKPYISKLPSDPLNTAGAGALFTANTTAFNYSYYSGNSNYCYTTVKNRQMYTIGYRMEGAQSQSPATMSDCTNNPIGPYTSTIRVVK